MPRISHNIHDQNFKTLMSEPDFSQSFLKTYLPKNLRSSLSLDTTEITPRPLRHLEPKTNKTFEADVVYLLKNTDWNYLLFIHIEHQSTPDKNIVFRIAHYQTAQIASYMKENPKTDYPPKVISLIYYQGEKPWPYLDLDLVNFKNYSPGLILLIDLPAIPDETLLKHKDIGKIEVLLKYIGLKKHKNNLEKLLPGLQTCNNMLREILLKYLTSVTEFSEDKFSNLIQRCLPKDKDIAMTLAEHWVKKGYQDGRLKGMQEGKAEGKAEGKMEGLKEVACRMLLAEKSHALIHEATGLSLKAIAKIKKEMTH